MNYFDLFELPVQLKVDKALIGPKFFELSRRYHPDYFVNEGNEAQHEALEKSAMLNKAFRTFQSEEETIKYVLQQKGLLEEEEKYELPPAFLMEVLDINEQLMDAGDQSVAAGLQTSINNLQKEIYEPVQPVIENYKEGTTTEKELLQVKEYYYKKKYIDRIKKELRGK